MTLSITRAIRGRPSQIRSPGTLVSIEPISPWISSGASGLGSNVSCCGGEPYGNSRMHDFALPNADDTRRARRACRARLVPPQQVAEAQPERAEVADVEQVPPGQSVAQPLRVAEDSQHRRPPDLVFSCGHVASARGIRDRTTSLPPLGQAQLPKTSWHTRRKFPPRTLRMSPSG